MGRMPLLDIRGIRPILILRRAVDDEDLSFAQKFTRALHKSRSQIVAFVLILAGLAFIASRVSDSASVGKWFTVGLVSVLAVLLLASFLVLKALKFFLSRTRLHLPSVLRHGLANLYRPGNPSSALLAALGMGVMQIMLVFLMQHAVVRQLHISSAPNLPNLFLIDIANEEVDGMRQLLTSAPGVTAKPELLPVVTSRILAIDGVEANDITSPTTCSAASSSPGRGPYRPAPPLRKGSGGLPPNPPLRTTSRWSPSLRIRPVASAFISVPPSPSPRRTSVSTPRSPRLPALTASTPTAAPSSSCPRSP
jgi:predicted lysophospholipase L1 biosynthesis ABC-type transport system permease subunit